MSRQADIWDIRLAIGALAVVASFYVYVIYLGQEYRELFRAFDAPLPIITRIVLGTYFYWSVLFVVLGALGCALILLRRDRRGWLFLFPVLISMVVVLPISVWAMYAPIFEMGSAS